MIGQVSRYYNTLKYLKPEQTLGRFYASLKKKNRFMRLPKPPIKLNACINPRVPFLKHDPWNNRKEILEGNFTFLNEKKYMGIPADWSSPDVPLLWIFNLNYFAYLFLLSREEQIEICLNWIKTNPRGRTVGWHPFPLSLRIVNWCKASLNSPEIIRSLYQQASYLYRNIEIYHPGNHLLENARALIFAGVCFRNQGEAPKWLNKGLEIFRSETSVQVLRDGGYFERSIMYHALMLEAYLDILNILPEDFPEDKRILKDAAERMSTFLVSSTHPDGTIALFNDSAQEIAPPVKDLLRYAAKIIDYIPAVNNSFPDCGYYMIRDRDLYMIIDGGPIGPAYLPAHAHADIFSYELSLKGQKFIVDSGVYEYPAGQMRSYVRSTLAHNTVAIDETDQAECWDSFRVARRYDPADVSCITNENGARFRGTFNGYSRLIGDKLVHSREIFADKSLRNVNITDFVNGRGVHLVQSLIHIHPDAQIKQENNVINLEMSGVRLQIVFDNETVSVEESWYCPNFGNRKLNRVIVITETELPAKISYRFVY